MSTKNPRNPETPTNPEVPETRQELGTLETQVTWDRRKFEALLKNSTLKSWLNKIFKKEAETTISTFWAWYKENELNRHLSIESWTRRAIKAHPDLAGFICWDLWLPYEELAVRGMKNTKFSQLTLEQKMWFISFQEALRYYNWDISRISSRAFIKQCQTLTTQHIKSMTDRFNVKLTSSQNLIQEVAGVVDLEKVLKKEYWFTENECKKMSEYLELIQKHPEYVTWVSDLKVNKAMAGWWWMLIWIWIWIALSIWWYFTYKYISGLFEPNPTEVRVYWNRTEVKNFKKVFKAMSAQAESYSNRRRFEEEGYGYLDESSWWLIVRGINITRNTIRRGANLVQKRELDLEVNTEVGYLFDFETVDCIAEIRDWKWYFYLKVKKPEVKIMKTETKIHESSRERVNMDKFDDFELKSVETLKNEALKEANTPEKIQQAKEFLRENLLSQFKITWFANHTMVIPAEDFEDVIVVYEDEQNKLPGFDRGNGNQSRFDSENKKTLVN